MDLAELKEFGELMIASTKTCHNRLPIMAKGGYGMAATVTMPWEFRKVKVIEATKEGFAGLLVKVVFFTVARVEVEVSTSLKEGETRHTFVR